MQPKKTHPVSTALNVLHEAVFIYDENMRIIFFNEAAERITGYERKQVMGEKCTVLFDKNLCINNCSLCMATRESKVGNLVEFESHFFRRDGNLRTGKFRAGLLRRGADGGSEVLVCMTDVTELTRLQRELRQTQSFQGIVGKSRAMAELFNTLQTIAVYDSTVFLQGESGTGKELAAQAIHDLSPRVGKPMIRVNCSAFPENLLESEMFGHVRGAFTGAERDRIGRFEEADGGTILLDEIGDLQPAIQVKLLRVLQEREIQRVGENRTRKIDVRIIAATHRDITRAIRDGSFREDLYYRLHVIPIHLPPLRERKEDIPHLCAHFIARWQGLQHKPVTAVGDRALALMMDYDWPGNVRELENAIEHACIKAARSTIQPEDLPATMRPRAFAAPAGGKKRPRSRITREQAQATLRQAGGNQSEAARLLGMHRITFWRKMRRWKLAP